MKKYIETSQFGKVEMIGGNEVFAEPVIVEKGVVERLASMLPSVDFSTIRDKFAYKVEGTDNMKDFCELLQDELSFQRTVNHINEEQKTTLEEYERGKIPLDDIDEQQMMA